MVGVAQLVRAPDCDSGGRGFETHLSPTQIDLIDIERIGDYTENIYFLAVN